jgi:hypothetical protein
MLETVAIPTVVLDNDPDSLHLQVTAIRETSTEPWYLFVTVRDTKLWALMTETLDLADFKMIEFEPAAALSYAKVCVLIGDTWDAVWDDTQAVLAYQQHALDHMGEKMRARLDRSSLEDIQEYRAELEREPIHGGELLRQQMIGVDPLSGRN